MFRNLIPLAAALLLLSGCSRGWTASEKEVIGDGGVLRVLSIDNTADSLVLRSQSGEISRSMLSSPLWQTLSESLVATVTDPSQDGVGIAGPQVGILRRVVAVQRFDKAGEPFEVYPNISIVDARGDRCPGAEGCLSVPDRRGMVNRYRDITIRYSAIKDGTVSDTTEVVTGFTAVIFQHECDHLDGVLYIDKLIEQ